MKSLCQPDHDLGCTLSAAAGYEATLNIIQQANGRANPVMILLGVKRSGESSYRLHLIITSANAPSKVSKATARFRDEHVVEQLMPFALRLVNEPL